jgi:ribonuclease D
MEFYGNVFTDYHKVPAHGATILMVMHTTDPREATKFIAMFERWLGKRDQLPIVGLDLEYTNTKPARAALLQLCMRDHCLLWHASVATRNCPQLIHFLNCPNISFASVDKSQDTSKLEALGARIPNHMDLQDHFNIPGIQQARTGAANMAAQIIDPTYNEYKEEFRKKKLHDTWHLRELEPEQIHYAAKDVYVCYAMYCSISIMRRCLTPFPPNRGPLRENLIMPY